MRWSFRIGRFFGIDVFVHATFLMLLAWVVASAYMRTRSWEVSLHQLLFVILVFVIVVLHEYGHALTARRFGVKTRDITLLPIGGVARLERIPENPWQEFLIAIAGPMVNVVLAGLCFIWAVADGSFAATFAGAKPPEARPDVVESLLATPWSMLLLGLNISLVLFNMIPAFPMDGGRVLRAVLAMSMDYVTATRIAASVGQFLALMFGFFGLMSGNYILPFIALFIWIGAAQEAEAVVQRSMIAGVQVREAMITQFNAVAPMDSLDTVAQHVVDSFQQDFPVADGEQVVGMISRKDLLMALAQRGRQALVSDVMAREFVVAHPDEALTEVVTRLQSCDCNSIPVVHANRLVGIITSENIGEYMMIRSALGRNVAA